MREPIPLVSCLTNKENIPPWYGNLALGMRSRVMGDDWDHLVLTFEHLEGDMNKDGVPLVSCRGPSLYSLI